MMNKKFLVKVLSLLLVVCMLVPMIPYTAVESDAAASSAARFFKAGSTNYGYKSGSSWTKGTTTHEAFAINGVTYLPTALVTAAFPSNSFVSGAVEVQLNGDGELVECIEAAQGKEVFKGYYVNVSNMNLIAIDTSTTVFSGMSDDDQILIMKNFLFDHLTSYKSDSSFSMTQALTTSSVPTLSHPYLLADQAEFDYLNRQWSGKLNSGETQDATLKSYLDYLVKDAENYYKEYASDDNGTLKNASLSTMTNSSNNGYDVGGRQQDAPGHASRIVRFAYAYQITRDVKYAKLALNYAYALSQWQHWGVGHFLNAADTSYAMALTYDWCYNVWGTIDSAKRTTVRDALFTKGVVSGVISSAKDNVITGGVDAKCPWYNPVLDQSGMVYQKRENNWNAVCASGMVIASLALLGDTSSYANITINNQVSGKGTGTETALSSYALYTTSSSNGCETTTTNHTLSELVGGSTIQSTCVWLINNNMAHLEALGLAQYVPDGSYIESATYWSYGTGSIMRMVAALETSIGTDFGLSSAWGLDTTAYFSYYVQSSDGDVWRYHDDGSSNTPLDVTLNGLYGAIIGDDSITAYKKYLIEKGVSDPSFYDTFKFDSSVDADDISAMPLDRYLQGIEGYTIRDSWESDGIYAAFMGGEYVVNHGQLDSGAFVYYNNGVRWLQDIGCDDYNVYDYGYGKKGTSLKYYPSSAEGNNTLVTNALQYGQYAKVTASYITEYGSATITDHGEYGAAGSYAVLDQSGAYTGVASSAKRGMLFTNDRTTVVIQDEISFNSGLKEYGTSNAHTAYWFAHVLDSINITISTDGKTAYLTDGTTTIRCTIVTGNDDTASRATFSVIDSAYSDANMVLSGTDQTGNHSTNNGGVAQKQYGDWQRLTVACTGITTMKLAIVIEEVAPGDNYEVGYEWQDMSAWGEGFAPEANSNSYDGKVLLSQDFDTNGTGKYESANGSFRFSTTFSDYGYAMNMTAGSVSSPASLTLASAPGKVSYATIGNGLLVVELDARQLEAFATASGTVELQLWGTDIYPNATVDLAALDLQDSWNKITLVIDEATDSLYVFVNNDLVTVNTEYRSRSYADLKLVIAANGSFSAGQLLIDNAVIRTYTEGYTELDKYLKSEPTANVGIISWSDKTVETATGGNVAKLYVNATLKDESTAITVSTVEALETAINTGTYKYVELYVPVNDPISIEKNVTVNTNGHRFLAVSDSRICNVTGNEYAYKIGNITITYYVNGSAKTVRVTKTQPFAVDVATVPNAIKERVNADGSYSYIQLEAGCWATEEAGEILSDNDRIVTSANATFYLTGHLYSGDFVVVTSNGSIAGYKANKFLTQLKTAHKRICVTNDFLVDGTGDGTTGNSAYSTTNLYLNGYTVTYHSTDTSDHLFQVSSGNINVYGPGTIAMTATTSNLIMQGGKANVNFNNIKITATYCLTDVRMGTCSFNNCDIYTTAVSQAFTVTNRESGKDNYTSDVSKMGILRFNGGSITHTGRDTVILVKDNSRLVLEGGVTITAPNVTAAVYMEQSSNNCLNDGTGGNYVEHIRLYLGETNINTASVVKFVNNITAGNTSVFDNTVFYIDGTAFEGNPTDYHYASSEYDADVSYTVGEHVLARTGSSGYAYAVVKKANAATVTWKGNGGNVTEYWVAGAAPYATGAALTNLASGYSYNMKALGGGALEGGKTYEFTATNSSVDVKMNVSLDQTFNINYYVEKISGITSVKVGGEAVDLSALEVVELDGKEYYKLTTVGIAPSKAAELVSVTVGIGSGVELITSSSIVNYAEAILASKTDETVTLSLKKLMSSIISYVGAAAAYEGDYITEASCKSIVDAYPEAKNDVVLYAKAPDTADVKDYLKSAYLELGATPAFAFRFKDSFTGLFTVSYGDYRGETVSVTLKVVDGIVRGSTGDVYKLPMNACDLVAELTITITDNNGEVLGSCGYSLNEYYTRAVQSGDELYRLLGALKAYGECARDYAKDSNK